MPRDPRTTKFLHSKCDFSEDGHQMGYIDSWPDREYGTGRDIRKYKYHCVFCLDILVVTEKK